ncbi:hypothetical protein E3Q18_03938 [Wallemia mellicola]|nr:hypothetical protein E3Q23_04472 [Wallemia mellicola]TIB95129.1 hypothetical protein E3Q18_03938 [Wallemia mellicola]
MTTATPTLSKMKKRKPTHTGTRGTLQEETSHISQNDIDERAQEELPKETPYTLQNGTDTQGPEELSQAASYASHNNAEEQEQTKAPYIKLAIPHYHHDTHTEEPVGQTWPNANIDDTPAPASVKTIYDRFDKQKEFPNNTLDSTTAPNAKPHPLVSKAL